ITPNGADTVMTYDALYNLTRVSEPVDANPTNNIVTTYGYDINGNRTRVTDGRGNSTITTYNSMDLVESTLLPTTSAFPNAADGTSTTKYDAGGSPIELDEPGNVIRIRTFNQAGWLTGESSTVNGVASASRTYGYDLDGRVASFSAPSGSVSLTYNDR